MPSKEFFLKEKRSSKQGKCPYPDRKRLQLYFDIQISIHILLFCIALCKKKILQL